MENLIYGLTKQLTFYTKLLEKTIAEKEAFSNNDNDLLMSILSERLKLMNEMSVLESELKPLRRAWIEKKRNFSDDFNQKVLGVAGKIKEIMDRILELENSVIEEKTKQHQKVISIPRARAVGSYKKYKKF